LNATGNVGVGTISPDSKLQVNGSMSIDSSLKLLKKLLYISILILLFSCTKGGGNMYVEGRVYNPVTGEGIEGIQIRLWKEQPSSGPYGPSTSNKYVETVYTNADGHYEIKHTGIFQAFYLKVTDYGENFPIGWVDISTKKKNYADVIPINSVKIIKSKNMHADFQAVPYGYLKLSIHNVNCQGATDTMVLERYNTTISSNYGFTPVGISGCYDDSTPPSVKIPAGDWELTWTATKSGVTTNGSVTIQVAGGQTTEYTLNY
jgi:hypothetical protein